MRVPVRQRTGSICLLLGMGMFTVVRGSSTASHACYRPATSEPIDVSTMFCLFAFNPPFVCLFFRNRLCLSCPATFNWISAARGFFSVFSLQLVVSLGYANCKLERAQPPLISVHESFANPIDREPRARGEGEMVCYALHACTPHVHSVPCHLKWKQMCARVGKRKANKYNV